MKQKIKEREESGPIARTDIRKEVTSGVRERKEDSARSNATTE